jgi:hypothetical protein
MEMESFNELSGTIALALGAGWASGLNLYAAVLVLGLLGATGNILLPEHLEILKNPLVIGAAGVMYVVEFVADKIPGADTGWDAIHTFIRIPAGAMLAAGAVGQVDPAVAAAAGILGGGLAAGSHALKAGSRVLINTSPEPFTNWTASVVEDAAVVAGLWTALKYPWLFLIFLVVFVVLLIWLLPKLWRGIKKLFAFIGRLLGRKRADAVPGRQQAQTVDRGTDAIEAKLQKLLVLFEKGVITQSEYEQQRLEILKGL